MDIENNTQTEIEITEEIIPSVTEAVEVETATAEEIFAEDDSNTVNTEAEAVFDTEDFARQLLEAYPNADASDERLLTLAQGKAALTPVELYRALNFDSLVKSAVEKASREAEAKLIGHIRASGIRPSENGTDRQREGRKTPPVTRLSRAERAKIAARAGRGERIEF